MGGHRNRHYRPERALGRPNSHPGRGNPSHYAMPGLIEQPHSAIPGACCFRRLEAVYLQGDAGGIKRIPRLKLKA
jgi:hypothetical protein